MPLFAMKLRDMEASAARSTLNFIERNPELFWSLVLAALVAVTVALLSIIDNQGEGYALDLRDTDQTLLSLVFSVSVYLGCVMAHDTAVV